MCYFIKLKSRMFYSILLVLIGIASSATGTYFRGTLLSDFLAGFYTGTGAGLLAVGVVLGIRNFVLMRNEAKRKKAEIEENDERTRFITDRTSYATCMTLLPALYISSLVSGFFNITVFFALLGATMLMISVLVITNLIVKAKY